MKQSWQTRCKVGGFASVAPEIVVIVVVVALIWWGCWATRTLWEDAFTTGLFGTLLVLAAGTVWIRQRRRLHVWQRKLAVTLESMSEGLVMVDGGGRVRLANPPALLLLGLPDSLLPHLQGPKGADRDRAEVRLLSALDSQLVAWRLQRPNPANLQRVVKCSTSASPDGGAVHVLTDVTSCHFAMSRVRHLAMHDGLTGLGNATLLAETVDELLADAASPPFVLLVLRLGRFKRISETLGQELSDSLLCAVVERLCSLTRPADRLFRRGGDDLAILSRSSRTIEQATALAQALRSAFEAPFVINGQELRLSLAIGLAHVPSHTSGRAELIRYAELACAEASAERAEPILPFSPDMIQSVESRVLLEDELRVALQSDEIFLVYQPQFRAATLDVIGFEALVRWRHPTRGLIGPASFISVAEDSGHVIELGRRVLREGCAAAMRWPAHIRLAINLSPVQFRDPGLIATIADELCRSGLPPSRLELEVTEGVLIADEGQALETFEALRQLGVRLALDDFGTGYSSLSYLRKFPFERIKLDRSFVQAQVADLRSRRILQCLLDMSAKLGLDVVAEGVETRTQLMLLRQQGCQDIQGFLVGTPVLAEEAERIASTWASSLSRERILRLAAPSSDAGADEPIEASRSV